jgi:hypothetical protein
MAFLAKFKQVMAEATPKVTTFPAIVTPILFEDGEHRVKRFGVTSWQDIEQIEQRPNFTGWAGDPRTGQVNIQINQADLTAAVKAWVVAMGPTRPH